MSAPEPPAPRTIPPYELLSEERLVAVERHADQLLDEIGLEIRGDLEAIRLWRAAGARISGEWRVHVPRGLAREIVRRSAPREFTQHARNPARSVQIGASHTVFAPAYGPPFVSDLDGGRRYGTLEDFRNFVKLTYASPWLHHSGGTVCEPVDVPVNKRRHGVRAHPLLRQAVHGLGHERRARRRFHRDVPAAVRGRLRRESLRDPRQRQRQFAARARR